MENYKPKYQYTIFDFFPALGAIPSPYDCYLVNRSLKTLALRMEQHKKNSLEVAHWLEKHPKVTEVLHPGTYIYIAFVIDLT